LFVLRSVSLSDLNDLYDLSGKVSFINLPHDLEIIKRKLSKSERSFEEPHELLTENYYFFVLEDVAKQSVIGVSMIHAQHGTDKEPHFFLRVANEHKYSQTINTGFVHGTLKLGLDTNGPTEIGGLVVDPEYRGNPEKLGKQISFVRFLYMAMNRDRFRDTVLSELMPPLDPEGNSLLWEALGRRFMNMDYDQADRLSRSNKEFILSLFPSDNIYMTLLKPGVRNAIGKVGPDTEPVKNMLEKIGFQYMNEVDPFDGGPHYKARMSDISLIRNYQEYTLTKKTITDGKSTSLLVSFINSKHQFYAIKTKAFVSKKDGQINLANEIIERYELEDGILIGSIPF
jgi:arginine N-succinyltransferase